MNRRNIITSLIGVGALGTVGGLITLGSLGGTGKNSSLMRSSRITPVTLRGEIGGEKLDFTADQDVKNILEDRYGITLDVKVRGSMDMIQSPGKDVDFLWPAHETAADMFVNARGRPVQVEPIFNSPIVILTWDPVIAALSKQSMVEKTNGSYYVTGLGKLLQAVANETTWADFGVNSMYGPVKIVSTHPSKSNSGLMFASLSAIMLNNGHSPSVSDMDKIGPDLRKVFERMGRLEDSSGRAFRQFLGQGMGAYPMLVAYENQMIEYWQAADERERKLIGERVRVMYPVPSLFATHPLLALNGGARKLIEALRDPDIRAIAWNKHGFRVPGAESMNKPAAAQVLGMPDTVTAIAPMPSTNTVEYMLQNFIPQN